jgi:hypothetical protein
MKSIRWLLKEAQEDAEKAWPGCLVKVELFLWADGTPGFTMTVSKTVSVDETKHIFMGPRSKSPSAAVKSARECALYADMKRRELSVLSKKAT